MWSMVKGAIAVRLRDESGMMAIGVALMLIVVLSLFGGAVWQYSIAELKRVQRTDEDIQALFLARAGAEMVMGAWQQEKNSEDRLFGKLDTIYYDLDKNEFTTSRPTNYLGTIDVEVRAEEHEDEEGGTIETIIIESAAKVGATMRTARLVTYPHRFGHQLGWYDESSGDCPDLTYGLPVPAEEPVIMRASSPSTDIHLARAALGSNTYRSIELSASNLIFDSPLKIVRNASDASSALEGTYKIVLAGERIFLAGLEIAFLSESTPLLLTYPEINFAVQLSLPIIDGQKLGWLGSEIAENVEVGTPVSDARYGEVYFNQAPAYYRVYEWRILRGVREKSGGSRNLGLSGQAFYFKDTDASENPLDPKRIYEYLRQDSSRTVQGYFHQAAQQGLLLPIKEEAQIKREDLESLRPFFWEQ